MSNRSCQIKDRSALMLITSSRCDCLEFYDSIWFNRESLKELNLFFFFCGKLLILIRLLVLIYLSFRIGIVFLPHTMIFHIIYLYLNILFLAFFLFLSFILLLILLLLLFLLSFFVWYLFFHTWFFFLFQNYQSLLRILSPNRLMKFKVHKWFLSTDYFKNIWREILIPMKWLRTLSKVKTAINELFRLREGPRAFNDPNHLIKFQS